MACSKTVVIIGVGDHALTFATAWQQAQIDWKQDGDRFDIHKDQTFLLDPPDIPDNHQPKLLVVDDWIAKAPLAKMLRQTLFDAGVDGRFVHFIQKDFSTLSKKTIASWGSIDLACIDAASPADNVLFTAIMWECIAPGGYLCLYKPMMKITTANINGEQQTQTARSPIWEEIIFRIDNSYEVITIPEPHKQPESGLGIVRKRLDSECRVRSKSLQAELVELGEVPIRNDILTIGLATAQQHAKQHSLSAAMTSPVMRSVYASVVLGANSIRGIVDQVKIDTKIVNKAIIRLLNLGLIQHDAQGFHDVASIWAEGTTVLYRDTENLSDRQLESHERLVQIAQAFHVGIPYSEAKVSNICQLFTLDFARLRRCLVDSGILQRKNNIYRRVR